MAAADGAAARRHNAAQAILQMLESDWTDPETEAVSDLRRRRADNPFILAVTEAVLWSEPGTSRPALLRILEQLDDRTWADEIGLGIAHQATLGVVSLGSATLAVLEACIGGLSTDFGNGLNGFSGLGERIERIGPRSKG